MNFHNIYFENNDTDVLLIQPHILKQTEKDNIDPIQRYYWASCNNSGKLLGDLPIEPNWGLFYLSASLKKNNYTVELLDFHLFDYIKYEKYNEFISYGDIEKIIQKKKFKVVGISTLTRSHKRALKIAQICKRLNPQCVVVLGGIHFSYLNDKKTFLLKHNYIDAILKGESEETFVELVNNSNNKNNWKKIQGITFKENDKTIYDDENFTLLKDLDKIPFPDYDLWPSNVPLIPRVYLGRGCVGSCDYCAVNNFFGKRYRKRDLNLVIDEIKHLYNKFNMKEFLIGDLSYPNNTGESIKFCKMLIENDLNVRWWCQTRPELLNEKVLKYMKMAGCTQIGIGIEAEDKTVLKNINSYKYNKQVPSIDELCRIIKKNDIMVQGYFILGLPQDNLDTSIKTIKLIDRLTAENLVDVTHLSVMVPYPGTKLFTEPESYELEILDKNYDNYLMNCDMMNSGVPVYSTVNLNNYQIYSLWQLALSTAGKNFNKRNKRILNMFNEVDTFVDNVEFPAYMSISGTQSCYSLSESKRNESAIA